MSALQPAHSTSDRPTMINVDSTGISMSWRTAVMILGVFTIGAASWTVFTATLARKADLDEHDISAKAHPMIVAPGEDSQPMPALVRTHEQYRREYVVGFKQLSAKVDAQGATIANVHEDMNEDRAERIADRIADKVHDARASREVWQRTKERAIDNLSAGRPIRDGLDGAP